jgi:hypothetical protein
LDGESSFYIVIHKSNNVKTGWSVRAIFEIHLHVKDKMLLEMIQVSLGVGSITTRDDQVSLKVYFKDFGKASILIKNKAHLTDWGLKEIRSIKAGMNRGRDS